MQKQKKHLLIVIVAILVIAVTSISLLVYIDIFKPSVRGAQKAYENGELSKAANIYESFLSVNPDDMDAIKGLYKTYLELERDDEAKALILSAYEKNPDSKAVISRLSKYYVSHDLNDEYKDFLINLYTYKSKKSVKKIIKSQNPVQRKITDKEGNSISNFLYRFSNSFRDQKVNIVTGKNKKRDYENIFKGAIMFDNYDGEKDELSDGIFEQYGETFSEYINSSNYHAAFLEDIMKVIPDCYDFDDNAFQFDENSSIYRIIDSSGLPDIFKYNNILFAKYSDSDKQIIYFPVINDLEDQMDGMYNIVGKVYRFNTNEFDVSGTAKPTDKKLRKEYNKKRKIYNSFQKWLSKRKKKYALCLNKKFYECCEEVNEFNAIVRQTDVAGTDFRLVRYKTLETAEEQQKVEN